MEQKQEPQMQGLNLKKSLFANTHKFGAQLLKKTTKFMEPTLTKTTKFAELDFWSNCHVEKSFPEVLGQKHRQKKSNLVYCLAVDEYMYAFRNCFPLVPFHIIHPKVLPTVYAGYCA